MATDTEMRRQAKPMVVAVANRKGGTGKTTTIVNLAAQWAEAGHSTLVVDLDTQGHAAIGLGCADLIRRTPGIHRIFTDPNSRLEDVVVPTPIDRIWLAPATVDDEGSDITTEPLTLRRQLLGRGVEARFDRVLIDTPPTLGPTLFNAMASAQAVLVPFVPHHLAAVGVKQLARVFYKVKLKFNKDLRLFGLVPVMFDRRIKLHRRVVSDMRTMFGDQRVFRGIRADIKLAEAFLHGRPIRHYSPKSRGALDYHMLADELERFCRDLNFRSTDTAGARRVDDG